jgi:hypothetical protein
MSPQPVLLSCAIAGGMSVPGQSAAIPGHRSRTREGIGERCGVILDVQPGLG